MFADFVPQWVRKALHLYCRIFTSQKTSRYVYTKPSVYILLWFLYCTDTLMCKKIPGPASGQIPFHCGQNFAVLEVFCAIYYLTNWYFRQKWKEEWGFWFFFLYVPLVFWEKGKEEIYFWPVLTQWPLSNELLLASQMAQTLPVRASSAGCREGQPQCWPNQGCGPIHPCCIQLTARWSCLHGYKVPVGLPCTS